MSNFTFNVGGKTAKGNVEKHQMKTNITFRATGNCPYCNTPFKVGFNPGDLISKGIGILLEINDKTSLQNKA